ncbi:MAG: DUF4401 domain-containing protein [Proteobacteria bacterium]|nr:MAG: DUF4401 domain-containing protein [Pseudomonadota bacterium]
MKKPNTTFTPDHNLSAAAIKRDQLWYQLKNHQLTTQAQCPEDPFLMDDADWMVRVLQGIGGWFAALFLLISMAVMMSPIIEYPWLCGVLGLVMNFATFHHYRHHRQPHGSTFLRQLFLVLSLAGQALVAYAITDFMGWQHAGLFLLLALYQVVLVLVMHDFVHRLMSALFAVTLVFWGHSALLATGVGSAILAIAVVWLWLDKVGWQAEKYLYEPLAYAAALALLALNIQSLDWYWRLGGAGNGRLSQYIVALSGLLHLLAYGFLYVRLQQGQMLPGLHRDRYLVVLVILGLGVLGFVIPGLSGALLLLLVGFAVRQNQLMALGVMSLLGFISWYYYQLDITLLNKAMLLAGLGLILLLVAWFGRRPVTVADTAVPKTVRSRSGIIVLTVLCALTVVNAGIMQKQQLIKHGDLLFLKLAPVDPRSLLQGDYMRLRFAVLDQVQTAPRSDIDNTIPQLPHQGIIAADAQQVGHWLDFYRGQELQSNHYLMNIKRQGQRLRLASDAYFFEEGSAATFSRAEYGGFRVNQSGDSVLVGLYDAQFKRLVHSPAASEN